MLRVFLLLIIVLISGKLCLAQEGNGKQLTVTSKTGTKLNFSEINVSGKGLEYKSLCIKYTNTEHPESGSITVAGKNYLLFPDKKSAVAHFYKEKDRAEQSEIYYVYSTEQRKPEVLSIRA